MSKVLKSIKPVGSSSCVESTETILNKALAPMGLTVVRFEDSELSKQAESKKPACGCDPIKKDGTKGHVCQEHLFEDFCRKLENGEIKIKRNYI